MVKVIQFSRVLLQFSFRLMPCDDTRRTGCEFEECGLDRGKETDVESVTLLPPTPNSLSIPQEVLLQVLQTFVTMLLELLLSLDEQL
jgi:hypothetical protein